MEMTAHSLCVQLTLSRLVTDMSRSKACFQIRPQFDMFAKWAKRPDNLAIIDLIIAQTTTRIHFTCSHSALLSGSW